MTKQNKKKTNKLKNFFNSPHVLFAVMTIFIIALMFYAHYVASSHKIYTFEGEKDNITVVNGFIDLNMDVDYFSGGKITYNGDDVNLKTYTMGYYICNKKDAEILSESNVDSNGKISMKNTLNNAMFTFSEPHTKRHILSKKNMDKIDNLCFKFEGTTNKDKEISIKVKLVPSLLSE